MNDSIPASSMSKRSRWATVLALLLPFAALALQWGLWEWLIPPHVWFLFFYPAVFASAWIAGWRIGLVATATSTALVWWFFIPPMAAPGKDPRALVPSAVFLGIGSLLAVFHERLRRTTESLRSASERAGVYADRLAAFVEHASDGIFVAGIDARYTDVNSAGCAMLGYTREEIIGRSILDLIPAEEAGRLKREKEQLETGATVVSEWRLRRKDGAYLPVEVSAKILPDGRWQGFVRDISERKRTEEQLRRIQERYDLALQGADLGAWDWNVKTGEVVFNDRWAEMRGYRLDEVKPHVDSWANAVHPDDMPRVKQALDDHFSGLAPHYEAEHRVRTKSGEWLWILDRGRVFKRDEHGAPLRMLGTELDITAQKDLEKELQEKNADLDRAQAVAQVGSWRLDIHKNELRWSDENYRIFGVPRGTPMTYEGFLACVHPADREYVDRIWKAGLRGEPYDIEHRLLVDGQTKWVREKADLEFDEEGRLLGGIGITHDLTTRRRLEEALRLSEAKSSGILAISADAIVSIDANRRITLFNEGAEKIFGWRKAEAMGQPIDILIPERFRTDHMRRLDVFAAGPHTAGRMGGPAGGIFGLRKNGEEFPADAAISNFEVSGTRILTVSIRDMTEQKRLESELRRALQTRDEVLGIVAHDLRNPLHSIGIQAALLRRRGPEPERRSQKPADTIQRAVARMNRLIQDLLDVSRMEAGRLSIAHARVSPARAVLDVVETQKHVAEALALALKLEVADDLPDVWADRHRLQQVLENLVSNSMKFTQRGGAITIGAAPRDGEVLFWVADTGIGLGPDEVSHVFDAFWQARKDARRGAGLGLAIVKGLVEAHGGRIWVESRPGTGSTFSFTIPTAPPMEEQRPEAAPGM